MYNKNALTTATTQLPDERQPMIGDRVERVFVIDCVNDANNVGATQLEFELCVTLFHR
jgi:hypothetical protein